MNAKKLFQKIKHGIFGKPLNASLNGLDEKLAKYLDYSGGFFIEAGANDGYSQSNTYFLEKKRQWRGLLIEGIPELYQKCVAQRPRCLVKNYALVEEGYEQSTVTMHYANLMSVVDGSLKTPEELAKHLEDGRKRLRKQEPYSIDVPAKTLEAVLDEIKDIPAIDFLSLDVEGYELSVLKGLKLSKYRPRYILVEARYFDEVNDFLLARNYRMLEQLSFHDYLYENRADEFAA